MNRFGKKISTIACTSLLIALISTGGFAATHPRYLITNDDVFGPNTVTIYSVEASPDGPKFVGKKVIPTGGQGLDGGYFAGVGVLLASDGVQQCVFAADSASSDVAGIVLSTQKVTGDFPGSSLDNGGLNGVTLAANDRFVYASYSGTYTIATYKIQPGCKLQFIKDVDAIGKDLGMAGPMAANGNVLVVTYGDGSIESFDISNGVPVPNGDEQFSSGSKTGNNPSGVVLTQDGYYAIFGDISGTTTVEVSDISSGKLAATVVYTVGGGVDANNVLLSPDESMLFVDNNKSGTVTAAFFDKTIGVVSAGCTSPVLKGFGVGWFYGAGLATASNTGNGGYVYVAEDGLLSAIGVLQLQVNGDSCELTETSHSHAPDSQSQGLRSLAVYPSR